MKNSSKARDSRPARDSQPASSKRNANSLKGRWLRLEGDWVVAVAGEPSEGSTVTIKTRSGETQTRRVARVIRQVTLVEVEREERCEDDDCNSDW